MAIKKAITKRITMKHLHEHILDIVNQLLIIQKQNVKIMSTQKEEAAKLVALKAQLGKANDEIQAKIQALQDAATNADNVSPELKAAIDDLAPAAQALDDIVPDVVDVPTDGGTGETPTA